ncbi:MAG: hypothetical protein B7Y31_06960 [Novosphingobium sp. 16-62-11]|nr:MAG: hypothetical protein B7Y31_06960 [Novosphingobium sp. 16-62-11]
MAQSGLWSRPSGCRSTQKAPKFVGPEPFGESILATASTESRTPGLPQGLTVIIAGFLPILAIVSMFPAIPAIIGHFAPTDPTAGTKVPSMVTAPGLTIALVAMFAGLLVDRFGRRNLLLISTFFYGIVGTAPFFLESLDAIYASRLLLGLCEAAILTTINTLIADFDVLLAPATPCTAPLIEDPRILIDGALSPARADLGIHTQPITFTALPALAVPLWRPGQLPLGLQLIGKPGGEGALLALAAQLEHDGITGVTAPERLIAGELT